MNTLGQVTKSSTKKVNPHTIGESFVAAAALPENAIVKLNTSTGKVEAIAASTDVPLGVTVMAAKEADSMVTVDTPYSRIVRAKATNATIALGAEISASSVSSEFTLVKAAAADDFVVGVALEGADANAEIWVGILYSPYKK